MNVNSCTHSVSSETLSCFACVIFPSGNESYAANQWSCWDVAALPLKHHTTLHPSRQCGYSGSSLGLPASVWLTAQKRRSGEDDRWWDTLSPHRGRWPRRAVALDKDRTWEHVLKMTQGAIPYANINNATRDKMAFSVAKFTSSGPASHWIYWRAPTPVKKKSIKLAPRHHHFTKET